MKRLALFPVTVTLVLSLGTFAAESPPATQPGDRALADYFRSEVAAISARSLADIRTLDDWTSRRERYRQQLCDMLGLWPLPQRTELKPVITGRLDHPQFTVEKLHFQSRPGLYVTGNLYVPKDLKGPAPAILYVCGHGNIKKDGVSFGAKTYFQDHPAWLARNGYVCLIIDTIQLGEIEGLHHGTYREKMWWWHSRGYVPSGVETWNGIRAIDYLESRPEVDRSRIGLTGRSGGGAHTWWIAALDERIKVAIPVAGITDMQNHVVDGVIEGHCDCMYMVNTFRWDFAQVAALLAPRPLLISNTDKDTIFPLDGVVRLHSQVRRIYQLHKGDDKLGLLITEGPHKDTQDLQVPAFRWFNRFLKNEDAPVEMVATKFFEPEQLKVFKELPADQINTRIHEVFVPVASAALVPESKEAWAAQRDALLVAVRGQCFGGWPSGAPALEVRQVSSAERSGIRYGSYEFTSQENVRLTLQVIGRVDAQRPDRIVLHVLDEAAWSGWPSSMESNLAEFHELMGRERQAVAWVAPRGIGASAWGGDERRQTQIRRRFALIGQTVDGMRVWDVRRAVQAIRSLENMGDAPLGIESRGQMAGVALYAALYEPGVAGLDLSDMPVSHRDGPHFLNVLRVLDLPAAVALAAERCDVTIRCGDKSVWSYPGAVAERLGWPRTRLRVLGP